MEHASAQRRHRHHRVRARVRGTADRPRLVVFRSSKHIAAQLIDDVAGRTMATAGDRDLNAQGRATVDAAQKVGALLAERAKAKKISAVVFDRGGHRYHGQVKALADGAREAGLSF